MATTGFDTAKYNARLAKLSANLRKAIEDQNEESAQRTADRLRKTTPEESGDLVETIKVTEGRTDLTKDVSVGGEGFDYVGPLEYGFNNHGTHVPGKHFFGPAVLLEKKKYKKGLTPKVRKAMRAACQSGDAE